MADIQALAASAKHKRASGEAVSMGIAIRKAINGVGILHKPDVKRLMLQVGQEIAKDWPRRRRVR